jgi:hypothetical protein
MRGVSRGFRRSAALFILLTVLMAQGAAARGTRPEPGWREQFARAKRFVITVLSRFGHPPGAPVDNTTINALGDSPATMQE